MYSNDTTQSDHFATQNARSSHGLVQCSKTDRNNSDNITAAVYADLLVVEQRSAAAANNPNGCATGRAERPVTVFSAKSRRTLFRRLAMMRGVNAGGHFVTLTYPDSVAFKDGFQPADRSKRDMATLRKRIARFFPSAGGVWRIEFQDRKSGEHVGEYAPHFHLLLFGITDTDTDRLRQWAADRAAAAPDADRKYWRMLQYRGSQDTLLRAWFRAAWYEIAHDGDEHGGRAAVQLDAIRSRRHAMSYASKYAGKVDTDSTLVLYLTDIRPGRHWGVFGCVDMSAVFVTTISRDKFLSMRRLIRSWLRRSRPEYARKVQKMSQFVGFSAFGWGDSSSPKWAHWTDSAVFRLLLAQ